MNKEKVKVIDLIYDDPIIKYDDGKKFFSGHVTNAPYDLLELDIEKIEIIK